MNTHETYKGYTLRLKSDNGGFNGRIHKNGTLVFDTWRPNKELAQADMKKWVDRETSPMAAPVRQSRMWKTQQRPEETSGD